jgi:hypothetical protein
VASAGDQWWRQAQADGGEGGVGDSEGMALWRPPSLPWRVRCGEGMEEMAEGAGGGRRRMRAKEVVGTARVALWWPPSLLRQGRCGEGKFLEGQRVEHHLPNAEHAAAPLRCHTHGEC